MTNSMQFSTKVAPLPGSLHARYARCGTPTCRCARGDLHGPYWRRFWREDGRTRSAYVGQADLDATRHAIEQWRQSHPSIRSLLRDLRALSTLGKEAGLW
jgi:hypothetical protein